MKFFLSISVLLLLQSPLRSQEITPDSIFLQKSKDQKLAGYITLGCGIATFIPGFVMLANEQPGLSTVNWDRVLGGIALVGVGAVCVTTSVVLFAASRRNEKNAYKYGMSFYINKPVLINTGLQKKYLPYSVGVRIPIK
jgi:hypothetical protein